MQIIISSEELKRSLRWLQYNTVRMIISDMHVSVNINGDCTNNENIEVLNVNQMFDQNLLTL